MTNELPPQAASRSIAVDIDDTLNDFTETLRTMPVPFEEGYALEEARFHDYLAKVRSDAPDEGGLLSTEYTFFRYKVHERAYRLARPRPDGVAFMRRLREDGWRIVICTHRDLRRAESCTRRWLAENGIPFDHLFMAVNKLVFCRAWGIAHLVDDHVFNVALGGHLGVNVYYPLMPKHHGLPPHGARGFMSFEEVFQWIRA